MYSTERAFGFTKEFRRLEGGGKSHYFLDQCREIVTEIGNALGFVRMVRSAALRYTSEAMEFLPHSVLYNTDENPRTSDLWDQSVHNANDGGRSAAAVQRAVRNVDEAMSSLASTVEERSDYLRVFLGLFQDTIAGDIDQHGHLENFYAMVPALTLCWMDASIQAKEAIKKSSLLHNQETYYVSDGFALGIAFLLATLKQNDAFDRLGWFRTLQNKYTVEAENLLTKTMGAPAAGEKPAESGIFGSSMFSFGTRLGNDSTKESDTYNDSDVGLAPSLKVTGKRLREQKREVELLFFAFHGSRIFFKDNS
jgi:WASH complex subunit 7